VKPLCELVSAERRVLVEVEHDLREHERKSTNRAVLLAFGAAAGHAAEARAAINAITDRRLALALRSRGVRTHEALIAGAVDQLQRAVDALSRLAGVSKS
jgi:hypothetical protein